VSNNREEKEEAIDKNDVRSHSKWTEQQRKAKEERKRRHQKHFTADGNNGDIYVIVSFV
jgi:hypothetical protein